MIDLHTHILPGVDDGAADLEEALRMARLAHASGTRVMVASPHMFHPSFAIRGANQIRERFEALREGLIRRAEEDEHRFLDEMQVLLGAENYWGVGFMEALARQEILCLDESPCVLVEFSPSISPAQLRRACRIVLSEGLLPLLAHVERYPAVRNEPRVLRELLDQGCLTQLNAGSLLGRPWAPRRRLSWRLLRAGLISLIASDGHGGEERTPFVKPALDRLRGEFPEDRIREWTVHCPGRAIGNPGP